MIYFWKATTLDWELLQFENKNCHFWITHLSKHTILNIPFLKCITRLRGSSKPLIILIISFSGSGIFGLLIFTLTFFNSSWFRLLRNSLHLLYKKLLLENVIWWTNKKKFKVLDYKIKVKHTLHRSLLNNLKCSKKHRPTWKWTIRYAIFMNDIN